MTTATEFQAKVDKSSINMDRFDQMVNGSDTTDVVVDGGVAVPSFAKVQKANTLAVDAAKADADRAEAARDALQDDLDELDTFTETVKPLPPEAGVGARFRIGTREYGRLDPNNGFTFQKAQILNRPVLDLGPEVGGLRFRWGNRELARWSNTGGWVLPRVTLPSFTPKKLPPEVGRTLRIRWGNRELGNWSPEMGMQFHRITLPIGATIADDPNTTLADRIAGAGGDQVVTNGSFVAFARKDSAGIGQIGTRRLSDGIAFRLTNGTQPYRSPALTADNKVLFWSEGDRHMMYADAQSPGVLGPVFPFDLISAEGDSLTAGAGCYTAGAHTQRLGPYPTILSAMLGGIDIVNRGVGGQTPRQISARDNGNPALLTVQGNQIPASGSVTVTAWSTPLNNNQGPGDIYGYLAGVRGVLKVTAFGSDALPTGYTFTRESAGSVVACPPQTPYFTQVGIDDRPKRKLFTLGRNDPTQMVAETAKVVAYQNALYPDFLVGAYLTAVGQGKPAGGTAENQQLAAIYGDRWVDLDSPPTQDEMAFLGFVPDSYGPYTNGASDAQNIADGWIPSGMRAGAFTGSGDFLHLNDFGYGLWALRYYRKIIHFNWFPGLPVI